MFTQVNYQDPTFFEEENIILTHRREAEMSFDKIIFLININQSDSIVNNRQVDQLLKFKRQAFDKKVIQNGLISYFSKVGSWSKTILDLIEKMQYELGLTDDSIFELNQEKVRIYLNFIVESHHKIRELNEAYQSDLKFLMN
jgi:hypothetical protein